jgi:hypothetical protein
MFAGSIAWYYHLYGTELHAMTPTEEGSVIPIDHDSSREEEAERIGLLECRIEDWTWLARRMDMTDLQQPSRYSISMGSHAIHKDFRSPSVRNYLPSKDHTIDIS